MATRKIEDVVKDLKSTASDKDLDVSDIRDKVGKHAEELSAIIRKEESFLKWTLAIFFPVLLFLVAYAIITDISADDLRNDVSTKKEIIKQYENGGLTDTVHTYVDSAGNEITVKSLLDDNMKLMQQLSHESYERRMKEVYLDVIREQYGIRVYESNSQIHVEAARVDSALMLLGTYRDKLKYDEQKHQWTISRTDYKTSVKRDTVTTIDTRTRANK